MLIVCLQCFRNTKLLGSELVHHEERCPDPFFYLIYLGLESWARSNPHEQYRPITQQIIIK